MFVMEFIGLILAFYPFLRRKRVKYKEKLFPYSFQLMQFFFIFEHFSSIYVIHVWMCELIFALELCFIILKFLLKV
jgi:hypothetical protein